MKRKIVFVTETIGPNDIRTEDRGQARIVTLYPEDEENPLFIRLQSGKEDNRHPEFDAFVKSGRKYRVSITEV